MSIELKGIHKAFGSNRVLKGFSLQVQDGETLAVKLAAICRSQGGADIDFS